MAELNCYEVVKAKDWKTAVANSEWKVGDKAKVARVMAIANSNDTFTVFPVFEKAEK